MDGVSRLLQSLDMNADEIAGTARLGVDRVRAIMEGAPADLAELRALSRGLRLPMQAFATGIRPTDPESNIGLLFRGALAENLPGQRATADYVAGFIDAALRVLPTRDHPPEWLSDMRPVEQVFSEAHRLAHQFRAVFMPGQPDDPAVTLPRLLSEEAGVIIGRLYLSRYEGASIIAGGYAFIFVSPRFPARMLFTLAHELGHIVAHHKMGSAAVFDSAKRIGAWRQRSIDERFVDAFASVLLLPERGVALALRSIREALGVISDNIGDVELLYLARFYGVSFDVAARRCEQLRLLPEGGAISLAEALKRDFKSPERRADELGLPPRPKIDLPKISDSLLLPLVQRIEDGQMSAGWAAERFGLSIDELFRAHARLARERGR